MSGGSGTDTFFIVKNDDGEDIITDFNPSETIVLRQFTHLKSIEDLSITRFGNDSMIDLGNNQTLILRDFHPHLLTNDHFVFYGEIMGTDEADFILGTERSDYIDGNEGDDYLQANEGHDTVYGGAGNDVLNGNAGHDILHGGDGNDEIFGGDGDDVLVSGTGIDELSGGDGSDTFVITRKSQSFTSSSDTIVDFDVNDPNEKIDLSHYGCISNFDELVIQQDYQTDAQGVEYPVTFVGLPIAQGYWQIIFLENVLATDINASHFTGFNAPPIPVFTEATVTEGSGYVILDVLDQVVDPDGDAVSIKSVNNNGGFGGYAMLVTSGYILITTHGFSVSQSDNGGAPVREGGVILYSPPPDFSGQDTFDYTLEDSRGEAVTQTVAVTIESDPTAGDFIHGSEHGDRVLSADKQMLYNTIDVVLNRYISQTIIDSTDVIQFLDTPIASFSDLVFTQQGSDVVTEYMPGKFLTIQNITVEAINSENFIFHDYSTDRNDTIIGGAGDDHLEGGAGNDSIQGDEGSDYLDGGAGDDYLMANTNNTQEQLYGGDGNDFLNMFGTGLGSSILDGGAGDDYIRLEWNDNGITDYADFGSGNSIDGGSGNDDIYASLKWTASISGGSGDDYIDVENLSDDDTRISVDGGLGSDNIFLLGDNFDGIGGDENDYISVTGWNSVIHGGSGDDYIEILGENNAVHAGDGNDFIIAKGNSTIWGGAGNDVYQVLDAFLDETEVVIHDFETSVEYLDFQRLAQDALNSLTYDNLSYIQDGNDVLITLYEGFTVRLANIDRSQLSESNFRYGIYGTAGDDILFGSNDGYEYIYGNSGNDILIGKGGGNFLAGGDGNDIYLIGTPISTLESEFTSIAEFEDGDKLAFSFDGTFEDLDIVCHTDIAHIYLANNQKIFLEGTFAEDFFTESHFIFNYGTVAKRVI